MDNFDTCDDLATGTGNDTLGPLKYLQLDLITETKP